MKQKQTAPGENPPAPAPAPAETNGHANGSGAAEKIRITIRNAHGLHARPAARLVRETRPFEAEITVRNLSNQRGPVSVRSLSSLASLEILRDNEIEFAASGDDAHLALERIATLVNDGLGDDLAAEAKAAPAKRAPVAQPKAAPVAGGEPLGLGGGLVFGRTTYLNATKIVVPQDKAASVDTEVERLRTAIASAQKALETRRDAMSTAVGEKDAGIYEAQMIALQDPELVDTAVKHIRDDRANAALAWDRANREVVARLRRTERSLPARARDGPRGRRAAGARVARRPERARLSRPSRASWSRTISRRRKSRSST